MKYSSKEIIDNVYRYEFTNGDDNVSVLYSRSGTANYIYETETAVKVTDIMGRQQLIYPVNGVVTIPLDGNVKYIKAVMGEIKETV